MIQQAEKGVGLDVDGMAVCLKNEVLSYFQKLKNASMVEFPGLYKIEISLSTIFPI